MEITAKYENNDLINLEATELRLGLPGIDEADHKKQKLPSNKRTLADRDNEEECGSKSNYSDVSDARDSDRIVAPPAKQQVVGWPPVRSYRKNSFQPIKKNNEGEMSGIYVKVSMDGAPYLRKIDLKVYKGYQELLKALENMFKFTIGKFSSGHYFEIQGYNDGSEFVPTYEDKDGDWMLVGDVPWEMFISSCKKLRIMRGSEARGLGSGM